MFVGAYSAAPYRLAFTDFHPERALGFLPHELDFTHLRMIWRRWKKKAHLKFCGHPVTPFGPEWLDRGISQVLGLGGDFVTDFRIIDYLASLLSTDESPGLDGTVGNDLRLKEDLAAMGVFHTDMPVYLLYRMRRCCEMGFSGFEGRHYSLFSEILPDMGRAVDLQVLVTALAYKYILEGKYGHGHIPDDPSVESERRQVFFGAAIGIPTFYVKKKTRNLFMAEILKKTRRTRFSRRYPGYLRVYNLEYRKALIELLKQDAADLIETMGLEHTVKDLSARTEDPSRMSRRGKADPGHSRGSRRERPHESAGEGIQRHGGKVLSKPAQGATYSGGLGFDGKNNPRGIFRWAWRRRRGFRRRRRFRPDRILRKGRGGNSPEARPTGRL